jgi:hypothetical protein
VIVLEDGFAFVAPGRDVIPSAGPPEANLSRAMHWLNVSYTVWFNRRHQRSGHLLQGRYKAIVVDPLGWGLELSRYVHLNVALPKGCHSSQQSRFFAVFAFVRGPFAPFVARLVCRLGFSLLLPV